jgi:hypothetical protein
MKQPYQPPTLEAQAVFVRLTGISLPIGTFGADPMTNFLDPMRDFLETEESQ